MPQLILTRATAYSGKLRNYGVYIDDKKIGTIADGETCAFSLSSGRHTLQVRMDWAVRSPAVSFNVDSAADTKTFLVGGLEQGKMQLPPWSGYLLLLLLLILTGLSGKGMMPLPYALLTGAMGLLLLYLFAGRNHYLSLTGNSAL